MTQDEHDQVKPGDHVWALMQNELVMAMKDIQGDYFVCGPWEIPVKYQELEVVSFVALPKPYTIENLYYID